MDFAACSMSQDLVAIADATPFVRTPRPDMHLDRPPVLPASPLALLRIIDPEDRARAGIDNGHHIPLPRSEDDRHAPLTGAGRR